MRGKTCICLVMILMLAVGFTHMAGADQSDLVWSTYLGSSDSEEGRAIAVDNSRNIYIAGYTYSSDFPTTSGSYDTVYAHPGDCFVTKFDPSGSALVFSTFLGGSGSDHGQGIAVDDGGNVYVAGGTSSSDFPTTTGAFDENINSTDDSFVTKLNPAGSALVYSTFLGGTDRDLIWDIAEEGGYAFVSGETVSEDFPTTPGAFDTTKDIGEYSSDAFVTKFNQDGSDLVYSTYLGGEDPRYDYAYSITVDGSGHAYVTGETDNPSDFPTTPAAFDTSFNGGYTDVFVTKLNSSGSDLVYSTFLGGEQQEEGMSIALDGSANAYITGSTNSDEFPTTPAAYDTVHKYYDVFVTKLNPSGSDLVYSTYIGGWSQDKSWGIDVDGTGRAWITGYTWSEEYPTTPAAYDTIIDGGYYTADVFVTQLEADGGDLAYSTFLGGDSWNEEEGRDIVVDGNGDAILTGWTASSDFAVTSGAYDTTYAGNWECFVSKFSVGGAPPPIAPDSLTITLAGEDLFLEWDPVTLDTNGSPIVVDSYFVYREIDSDFFGPGSDPFDGTVVFSYLDTTGAVGDTTTHYYYAVTAVSGGMESEFSAVVGEFDARMESGVKGQ